MSAQNLFQISIAFGFVAWGIAAALYIWPSLIHRPRAEAFRPLLCLHSFRFVGTAFLVPGVVSPELPFSFAGPAAYGDLGAAVLAILALAAVKAKPGIVLIWAFNLWGTADLLLAFFHAINLQLPAGQLGAAYFIPTFLVPLLLITHALMFRLLLRKGM